MGNYDFKKDLSIAKRTENEFEKMIRERMEGEILEMPDGYHKEWDIRAKCWGVEKKFEIKEDFRAWETGNVAVEYESRGRLSGISTTTADYFIYKIHEDGKNKCHFYAFPVKKLKELIKEKEYAFTANGGDIGSNTMVYLFRLDKLKEIAFKLS